MEYWTTGDYHSYPRLFEQNSSVNTTTIFLQKILASIKQKTSLAKNTIDQASEEILRSMSKVVMYTWVQKKSNTNLIATCTPYQYRLIDEKIF